MGGSAQRQQQCLDLLLSSAGFSAGTPAIWLNEKLLSALNSKLLLTEDLYRGLLCPMRILRRPPVRSLESSLDRSNLVSSKVVSRCLFYHLLLFHTDEDKSRLRGARLAEEKLLLGYGISPRDTTRIVLDAASVATTYYENYLSSSTLFSQVPCILPLGSRELLDLQNAFLITRDRVLYYILLVDDTLEESNIGLVRSPLARIKSLPVFLKAPRVSEKRGFVIIKLNSTTGLLRRPWYFNVTTNYIDESMSLCKSIMYRLKEPHHNYGSHCQRCYLAARCSKGQL